MGFLFTPILCCIRGCCCFSDFIPLLGRNLREGIVAIMLLVEAFFALGREVDPKVKYCTLI